MNFQKALLDYLILRRSLGFQLTSDGKALKTFIGYLEENNYEFVTTDIALHWAKMSSSKRPVQWGRRLGFVRGFTRYLSAFDERTEIPPINLLPTKGQRPAPYLLSDKEILQLLQEAKNSSRTDTFLNHTLYCLLGLMSVTGLRVSEAINLSLDDIDFETGILTIRNSKFNKSRIIPLHPSTVNVLSDYKGARKALLGGRLLNNFFINHKASCLSYEFVRSHFRKLIKTTGINSESSQTNPRLHHLRHRFAVSTLIQWYEKGLDVDRKLPMLSAYLGHIETRDTYWYISACPLLMNAAKDRMENNWRERS